MRPSLIVICVVWMNVGALCAGTDAGAQGVWQIPKPPPPLSIPRQGSSGGQDKPQVLDGREGLRSGAVFERMRAIEEARGTASELVIAELDALLENPREPSGIREAAAAVLLTTESDRVLPYLRLTLGGMSQPEGLRRFAIKAISDRTDYRGLPALARLIENQRESAALRSRAILSLSTFRMFPAIEPLARIAQDRGEAGVVRAAAIHVLLQRSEEAFLRMMLPLFNDPTADVVAAVVDGVTDVLRKAGGVPNALDPDSVIRAFEGIAQSPSLSPAVRAEALTGMALVRTGTVDVLLAKAARGDASFEVRYAGVKGLGRVGTTHSVNTLLEIAEDPKEIDSIRVGALSALGQASQKGLGSSAARRVLRVLERAVTRGTESERGAALVSLGAIRNGDVTELLVRTATMLRSGISDQSKALAIRGLRGRVLSSSARQAIIRRARKGEPEEIRLAVIDILDSFQGIDTSQELQRVAFDVDERERFRVAALNTLARMNLSTSVNATFQRAFYAEAGDRVRLAFLYFFGASSDAITRSIVLTVMGDSKQNLEVAALFWTKNRAALSGELLQRNGDTANAKE